MRPASRLVLGCLFAIPATAQGEADAALRDLRSENVETRLAALLRLREVEPTRAVQEAVVAAIPDDDPVVRARAIATLVHLRPDLKPAQKALRQSAPSPQIQLALGRRGRWILPAVGDPRRAQDLGSADPQLRIRAIQEVCAMGEAAATFRATVLALIDDENADVRAAVARSMANLAWDAEVRRRVAAALKDPAAAVRGAAAEGLRIKTIDRESVSALRGAIQDPDVDVRRQVLQSLGESTDGAAAADIVASLRDREAKVRVAALDALRTTKLRTDRAPREIIRCLADPDRKVLLAALRATGALGPDGAAAAARVLELTRHARDDVRGRAIEALWPITAESRPGFGPLRAVEMTVEEGKESKERAAAVIRAFLWPADG